jgi:hypothetical protein
MSCSRRSSAPRPAARSGSSPSSASSRACPAARLWQDLKVGVEHLRAWKRIAVVTDIEWVDHMIALFGWMTPGEVRHFPLAQRDEAIAWAAAR